MKEILLRLSFFEKYDTYKNSNDDNTYVAYKYNKTMNEGYMDEFILPFFIETSDYSKLYENQPNLKLMYLLPKPKPKPKLLVHDKYKF
jgi:hypothetical protein